MWQQERGHPLNYTAATTTVGPTLNGQNAVADSIKAQN